jgi:acyl-CoA-binding protein
MPDLKAQFETAAEQAQQLKKRPSNDTLLLLYALYKQATVGDINTRRPGFTDVTGRAKWDAWESMKGKSRDEAMQLYIALVEKLKK